MEIRLISDTALADSAFDIIISGLKPSSPYRLEMTLLNYYNINAPMNLSRRIPWRASGLYDSDQQGCIRLSQAACQSGSYRGQYPMGLFFNSRPDKIKKTSLPSCLEDISLDERFDVLLEVFEGKRKLGELRFPRYYQLPHIRWQDVSFSQAKARLFYPEKAHNFPAIVVLSGSDGRIEKAQNIAQLLASHGFVTMALSYFGLEGTAPYLDRIDLAVVEEAATYLATRSDVDSSRLGLYGRSKGAEMALCVAAYLPDYFQCLVLNSPSCAVMEGLKSFRNSGHSSWVYQGKALPYTHFSLKDFIKSRLLRRPFISYCKDSLIPVDSIKANVLLIGSERDEVWPAADSIKRIEAAWNQHQRPLYHLESLLLKNSGHMLSIAFQPNNRYKKIAWPEFLADSQKSWQATLDFFKNYL
ncbi:acyl-CoA thioesterase/BAAT N-terminal domain-containing protein [Streptococcus dentasini]